MKNFVFYNTTFGNLCICEEDGFIVEIMNASEKQEYSGQENEITKLCFAQLEEFFLGKRKEFSVPIRVFGTPFQEKVWKALIEIPYGQTASYQEIAIKVGSEKACRAVGGANHRNPIPFIIPCHRVIGKQKQLVGFGLGLDKKQWLLDLENKNIL